MITQELLSYLRNAMKAGESEADMRRLLKQDGGWSDADIDEALSAIRIADRSRERLQAEREEIAARPGPTPAPSSAVGAAQGAAGTAPAAPLAGVVPPAYASPSMPPAAAAAPSPQAAIPGVAAPVPPSGTAGGLAHERRSSGVFAGLIGVLLFVGTYPFLIDLPPSARMTAFLYGAAGSAAAVIVFYLLTKLVRIKAASFGRAMAMVAYPALAAVLAYAAGNMLGNRLVQSAAMLAVVIGWFVLFIKMYKTGFGKALAVGVLNIIISGAAAAAIFFTVGFGFLAGIASSFGSLEGDAPSSETEDAFFAGSGEFVDLLDDAGGPTELPGETAAPDGAAEHAQIPFETIARAAYSGHAAKSFAVIRDEASWQAFWELVRQGGSAEPMPEVDFDADMVIAVTRGFGSTGGFDIEIAWVRETATALEIGVLETVPGPDSIVTMATTAPYHAVAVPASSKEPVFISL